MSSGMERRIEELQDVPRRIDWNLTGGELLSDPRVIKLLSELHSHNPATFFHSGRVAQIARYVAGEMGMSTDEIDLVTVAGMLHDIGKRKVPTPILDKVGKPTKTEWRALALHPGTAHSDLQEIHPVVAAIVGGHHLFQRVPYAYVGAEKVDLWITEARRTVAVADQVDALMSARSYKSPWSADRTRAVMTQDGFFPPALISVAVNLRSCMLPSTAFQAYPFPVRK